MKILLIQPAKPEKALGGEDFSIFEPLALEYLAAGVAAHHDIRILDMLGPAPSIILSTMSFAIIGPTSSG